MCSARLAGCSHVAEAPAAQVRLGHLTELALDTVGGRTGGNDGCEMMKSMTLVWWPERGGCTVHPSSGTRPPSAGRSRIVIGA